MITTYIHLEFFFHWRFSHLLITFAWNSWNDSCLCFYNRNYLSLIHQSMIKFVGDNLRLSWIDVQGKLEENLYQIRNILEKVNYFSHVWKIVQTNCIIFRHLSGKICIYWPLILVAIDFWIFEFCQNLKLGAILYLY